MAGEESSYADGANLLLSLSIVKGSVEQMEAKGEVNHQIAKGTFCRDYAFYGPRGVLK